MGRARKYTGTTSTTVEDGCIKPREEIRSSVQEIWASWLKPTSRACGTYGSLLKYMFTHHSSHLEPHMM